MTKKSSLKVEMITRDILVEELSASERRTEDKLATLEHRVDAKVDSAVQSMKDYTDSRFNQLDTKLTGRFDKMDQRFDKLERYFEQLVGMFNENGKKLNDHESRIRTLEARN